MEDLQAIIDIQLADLRKNLEKKNNILRVSKSAKEILIRDGSHREWGARPLRRMIQNEIENEISTKFLTGEFIENGIITVKSKNKQLNFSQDIKKEISSDLKFKKDKVINKLQLVSREEFEVLKKIVQKQDAIIKKLIKKKLKR